MVTIDYAEQDLRRLLRYLDKRGTVSVEELKNHSGADPLRIYPLLFDLEKKGEIIVERRSPHGVPVEVRKPRNLKEQNESAGFGMPDIVKVIDQLSDGHEAWVEDMVTRSEMTKTRFFALFYQLIDVGTLVVSHRSNSGIPLKVRLRQTVNDD